MELWELEAREAIRDLVAAYTWAGDRGRSAELVDLFAIDGVLDAGTHGGAWEGRDRIRAELDAVAERVVAAGGSPGPVRHHVSNVRIRLIDHDEAEVLSYFAVLTTIGLDHWGRYRDRVVRDDDGAWRFAERSVRVDGHVPGSLMVEP
ncbi:MAG: nuclear transport factor 2 family protein [Actinobacteria bacterium]|nr:nuclear transport factor 2 family protein [Actinomycetota bacterium]